MTETGRIDEEGVEKVVCGAELSGEGNEKSDKTDHHNDQQSPLRDGSAPLVLRPLAPAGLARSVVLAVPPLPPLPQISATPTETYPHRPTREPAGRACLMRCRAGRAVALGIVLSHSGSLSRSFVVADHDAAMTAPLTLRSALRVRVDQWHLPDRRWITDRALDDAIGAAAPRSLFRVLAHHSPISAHDIDTISRAIMLDHEGFDDDSDPFWVVHDSSGRTESDVTWGVAYAIGRILTLAENRLLDTDAHRFPKLAAMRATTDPDVQEWLDECVRGGTIPASALTRFPAILSLTERDTFRLHTLAQPLDDRDWTADDLAHYARGFLHRRPGYADALVQTTIEAAGEASWAEAVKTIQRIRTAADGLPWSDARS